MLNNNDTNSIYDLELINNVQDKCDTIEQNNISLSEQPHINYQNSDIIDNLSNNPNTTSIFNEPFINTNDSNEN